MFITFEGIEGSGKSTQRNQLLDFLKSQSIEYIETREPGGTVFGTHLRDLLLSRDSRITQHRSELFLFAADRMEHIHQVIQPALSAGKWVICDRYIDSTFAYQYGGRQHPKEDVLDIIRLTGAIEPDLTFFLDVSVSEGLRRASNRGVLDRFEQETAQFHERVRHAYLECLDRCSHRFVRVIAENRSVEDVAKDIQEILKRRLNK